ATTKRRLEFMEREPVERVHDGRDANQAGGNTPNGAGLCTVRVDDVEPTVREQTCELVKRSSVGAHVEVWDHMPQPDDLEPGALSVREQRAAIGGEDRDLIGVTIKGERSAERHTTGSGNEACHHLCDPQPIC